MPVIPTLRKQKHEDSGEASLGYVARFRLKTKKIIK